jgi:broad specificity phosphatase PhoE
LNQDFFSTLEKAVDFFIIRHGQSEGNASKIMQGREEFPLSETGRLQAAARGRVLKTALAEASPGRTLLFSSPLGRAGETARIIAMEAGLPEPVYLDDLIEMKLGIWSGKTWDQAKKDDPELWAAFMARSWDAIPGAESSAVLYKRSLRLWAVLRDMAKESGAENIVVVTHGGLIQWLLKTTFQCRSWFPLFPISNGGLFKFCVQPHPVEKSAYLCWEEIDSPLPNQSAEPRGFPS